LRNYNDDEDDEDKRRRTTENKTATAQAAANNSKTIVSILPSSSSSLLAVQNKISNDVPKNRRDEIYEFMKLFGYKPERTIIQVHITGFFRKKKYTPREIEQHKTSIKRYGGTTFVVIGRTHDPSIMEMVVKPKKKNPYDNSPGYIGYLWKNKDPQKMPPHKIIPLDFTPIHLPYPPDWKSMFATKGFMITMHVPSSLARDKNKLTRSLYRIGKSRVNVKREWNFLNNLKNVIAFRQQEGSTDNYFPLTTAAKTERLKQQEPNYSLLKIQEKPTNNDEQQDPLRLLKLRLAKGEIGKKEYDELYKAKSS
jgi:hypothetical protein